MQDVTIWIFRTMVGGGLIAGYAAVLWRLYTGGDVHPDDKTKPLYIQRVKMGSSFRHKSYGERWGSWIGLTITLAPVNFLVLYGLHAWASSFITLLTR